VVNTTYCFAVRVIKLSADPDSQVTKLWAVYDTLEAAAPSGARTGGDGGGFFIATAASGL